LIKSDQLITFHQAYVLHSRPYRETSVIVDLLHVEGRISCVANGIRGKRKTAQMQRAVLQPFQPLSCVWVGKSELKTLTKFEINGASNHLEGDALLSGFYLNELLTKVYKGGSECESIYKIYRQTIESLSNKIRLTAGGELGGVQAELRHFEFLLLEKLGYGVNFITEAQSGASIQPDMRQYRYIQELGFVLQERRGMDDHGIDDRANDSFERYPSSSSRPQILTGEAIVTIREALNSRQWKNKRTLRDAKQLSRAAYLPLLGGQPIETRRLFQ